MKKTIVSVFFAVILASNAFSQNSADAHYSLGREYLSKDEFEKAILEFSEAINLDKNHAAAYFWRGYVYQHYKYYPNDMGQSITQGSRNLSARIGNEVYDIDYFAEKFNRPDIIESRLKAICH